MICSGGNSFVTVFVNVMAVTHNHPPYLKNVIRRAFYLFAAIVLFCLSGCAPKGNTIVGHPLGYDLQHPRIMYLPTALNEISGIIYYPKDSTLFAIEDEAGFLYKIYPHHHRTILRWKFGTHGDYEDVAMKDSVFYVLRSDGNIFGVVVRGENEI